jgi:TatD DNase family protein
MLHVRNAVGTEDGKSAYDDTLSILEEKKKEYGNKLRGNSHFFTGSEAIAKRYFSVGFTVSFTGLITYNNSFNGLIKSIPIEMIHAETDSPFVAPVPYKGQRSEPSYVTQVVKKIAEIKEMTEEIVIEKLLQNAYRLFNLRA